MGAHLVETIGPGGFWGEASLVSEAPQLCEARAVTECVCYAVPRGLIDDIPVVQWELQETFERRLRSFRAGFRFEWSDSFKVDVAELDDQHRKLFALANGLSELIGSSGRIDGHDAQKRALLSYTRLHFQSEESLMTGNGYPRAALQQQEHAALLAKLERFVEAGERRARPRPESAVDYLKDWLISHTLLEDLKYRPFFALKGIH